jgi:hypothetical protein
LTDYNELPVASALEGYHAASVAKGVKYLAMLEKGARRASVEESEWERNTSGTSA